MKKVIVSVSILLAGFTAFSQAEKKYLPETGDWSIGIDANPFLNYLGNFIGGNGTNAAPSWTYLTSNQTITGKYFASENKAYRAHVRLGFSSTKDAAMVKQDGSAAPTYPATPSLVEDSYKRTGNTIGLGGGLEFRKNKGRLVGLYGAEAGISLSGSTNAYTYGNPMTTSGATSHDFGSNLTNDPYYGQSSRITEEKSGSTFGIGVRGFIGAEYFVFPRISLGGEFGWGIAFLSTSASSTSYEGNNGTVVGTVVEEGAKSSDFTIDTDGLNSVFGPAATLKMSFYF
jgi:hypothetical protein